MPRRPQRFPAVAGWEPRLNGVILGAVDSCLEVWGGGAGGEDSPGDGRVGLWALDIQKGYLQGEYGVTEGAH